MRRIVSVVRPYWPTITIVGLFILVTAGLGVVNPILIRVVFDSALFPSGGGPDFDLLWILFGVMAGIIVVVGALGVVQTYFTNLIRQNVMRDLRDRLFQQLEAQPLSFFACTRIGEIQSRVSNDVGGVQTVVTSTLSEALSVSRITLSKFFGRQNQETERFHQENQRLSELVIRQEMNCPSLEVVGNHCDLARPTLQTHNVRRSS